MMKKTTILFLILLGIADAVSLKAQQSVQEALSYYPLQIGDEWQYQYSYNEDIPSATGYKDVMIIGDTLMENHHRYQILQYYYYKSAYSGPFHREDKGIYYERVDSTTANVYRFNPSAPSGEVLRDSLTMQVGDTLTFIPLLEKTVCYDTTRWLVFGVVHPIKRLSWGEGGFAIRNYDLARGLGIIYNYYESDGSPGDTDTLIYAKINGVTYGTYVETPATPIEHMPRFSRPYHFLLRQNYPNPFNPTTTIHYQLVKAGPVTLTVWNVLGRRVATLANGTEQKGAHQVTFNASNLASGVYFYRLKAGEKVLVKKMLLMK